MKGNAKIIDIMANREVLSNVNTIDKAMLIIKKSEEELKFDR
jgi:hypothetical protein